MRKWSQEQIVKKGFYCYRSTHACNKVGIGLPSSRDGEATLQKDIEMISGSTGSVRSGLAKLGFVVKQFGLEILSLRFIWSPQSSRLILKVLGRAEPSHERINMADNN